MDSPATAAQAEEQRRLWMQHWSQALECPDAERLVNYRQVAVSVGGHSVKLGQLDRGRRCFLLALTNDPGVRDDPQVRAEALAWLAGLEGLKGKPAKALELLNKALVLDEARDDLRLERARARAALAAAAPAGSPERAEHQREARADLERIPEGSPFRPQAQAELVKLPPP
jgi:tetratricopeptide (TPR) repeat protein